MLMAGREFNVSKNKEFSKWYNEVIYAADLVDIRYNLQGFIVHKPWAMQAIKKLYALFEAELEADGHLPVLFPTLIPEENFTKEAEHFAGFVPNVFLVTKAGGETLKRNLALRPTSETAFYQMYKLWIQSQSDLPLKYYQSCSVFRFEHETIPFMRGREFLWIETHDAFATLKESEDQVKADIAISRKVLSEQLGVMITVFQRPQWDKFPGADNTFAYDILMPDGKVNQAGATHLLGQNFTKSFEVTYPDQQGAQLYPYTTCFGPGIWRMTAAIISVHGDDKGLILPPKVAPIQVVIVPILKDEAVRQKILDYCKGLLATLGSAGLRAAVDDSGKTPGFKFNYWELKGVPLRIEVGAREVEAATVTITRRDNRQKTNTPVADLVPAINTQLELLFETLKDKATADLSTRTLEANSLEDLKAALDGVGGGIVRIPLCSIGKEGTPCGEEIQSTTTGAKVRGVKAFENEGVKGGSKCIVCQQEAKVVAYVARQY
jgi:prolyl-tRNA synthetase